MDTTWSFGASGAHWWATWSEEQAKASQKDEPKRPSASRGAGFVVGRGLENDNGANHCFLNVVIQALWNLDSFRKRLLAAPIHPHSLMSAEAWAAALADSAPAAELAAPGRPAAESTPVQPAAESAPVQPAAESAPVQAAAAPPEATGLESSCTEAEVPASGHAPEDAGAPEDPERTGGQEEQRDVPEDTMVEAQQDPAVETTALEPPDKVQKMEHCAGTCCEGGSSSSRARAVAAAEAMFTSATQAAEVPNPSDSCCYCALKSVFSLLRDSEEDGAQPPDVLRKALSRVFVGRGRFQIGEMEDATEAIEALLGTLHACNVEPLEPFPTQEVPTTLTGCAEGGGDPAAKPRLPRRQSEAERVEMASDFGCHPRCIGHEVFGIEQVDLTRCTYCGATGEPSVTGAFLYRAYVAEMISRGERMVYGEAPTTMLGSLQDSMLRLTQHFSGGRPITMQEVLQDLCQHKVGSKCPECSRSSLRSERWLTQRPCIFALSLVWPTVSPSREELQFLLSMLRGQIRLEQIFRTDKSALGRSTVAGGARNAVTKQEGIHPEDSYVLRGLICYYGMHYVALFWCPARVKWILFDDSSVREEEDWKAVGSLIMSGKYLPTLIFYERLAETDLSTESMEELQRQVAELAESQASCCLM